MKSMTMIRNRWLLGFASVLLFGAACDQTAIDHDQSPEVSALIAQVQQIVNSEPIDDPLLLARENRCATGHLIAALGEAAGGAPLPPHLLPAGQPGRDRSAPPAKVGGKASVWRAPGSAATTRVGQGERIGWSSAAGPSAAAGRSTANTSTSPAAELGSRVVEPLVCR